MVDEVRTVGWGGRLGRSIKGVLVGALLSILSFPLLFWNEGRAVHAAKGLEEGQKAVVSVSADKVDAGNEKKLVHLTGEATTAETLTDDEFPAASAKAIVLSRDGAIYQWIETKEEKKTKSVGGSERTEITYHFEKSWMDRTVDSSEFHKDSEDYRRLSPVNAGTLPYTSKKWNAKKITLGAFTLPDSLVSSMATEKLEVKDAPSGMAVLLAKVADGGYYFGIDPKVPLVGDVRVSFQVVRPQTVSVLGQQVGDLVGSYSTTQDTTILRLDQGTKTADAMFQAAKAENAAMTWILRLVGLVMMFIGLALVFEPLGVLADILPFMGDLLRLGTGLFAGLLALSLSLLTISVAWVFYRPLLGVPLLVGSVALLVYGKKMGAGKRKS